MYDGPDIKENNTLIKYLHDNVRRAAEVDWHFDNGEQNSIMDSSWLQYLSKVFCQGYYRVAKSYCSLICSLHLRKFQFF